MIGIRAATGGTALRNAAVFGWIGTEDAIGLAPVVGAAVTVIAIMKPAVRGTVTVKWL
jgi:hypothetical protein